MTAHLAQSSPLVGVAVIVALVVLPNAALAVWALLTSNERTGHADPAS